MKDIAARAGAFASKWSADPESVDTKDLLHEFESEMVRGLEKGEGSLEMIPTYISVPDEIPAGEDVIVIDAGGTNLRTCLIRFDENGKAEISDFRKTGMPGVTEEVSASRFFSLFADEVERLIDKSDRIGFCFSYAAAINADHDGVPIMFSKEIKAPEVIGMPVGKSLLKELERRGHDISSKKVAVLNDTVATLLAGQASGTRSFDGYIGFILGTGTNTAYVESNENITKLGSLEKGSQVINVESGNFNISGGVVGDLFFKSTKDPDSYHLEKMIGGAYLGPHFSLLLEKAVEENLFSASFAERFAAHGAFNTIQLNEFMTHPGSGDIASLIDSEDDREMLYRLIDRFIAKAAKLSVINITAAVLKSGRGMNPTRPVCLNMDGSTYWKTETMRKYVSYYMIEITERMCNRYVVPVKIEDSPAIGAAIAGLTV